MIRPCRKKLACLALVTSLGAISSGGTVSAAGRAGSAGPAGPAGKSIVGRVVDDAGAGLAGATIFLMLMERVPPPACARVDEDGSVAVVKSDADGAFSALLPVGRYRVTAFKSGYEVAVTEVNTLARGFLDLTMRPGPRVVLGDLPVGPASGNLGLGWILRQQPSDVLREREASLALPESGEDAVPAGAEGEPAVPGGPPAGPSPRSGWAEALFGPIDGALEQQVTGAGLRGRGEPGSAAPADRSTALVLRGAIGDEGTWRFDGWLGRTSADLSGAGGRQARRSDRMTMGFDYRLGPSDDLSAEVLYGTNRYVVDPDGETVNATDQAQRDIGLRSRWNRALGDEATLYVDGSYFETGVKIPDANGWQFALPAGEESARKTAIDRAWVTTAGLAFAAGGHRLDFGLRTKNYRYDLRDQGVLLYGLGDAPSLAEPGEQGSALSLFGGDRFGVGERYELDYGLRYHRNLAAGSAYVVPRLGLWRRPSGDAGFAVRTAVLYRVDEPWLASLRGGAGETGPAQDAGVSHLGYLVSVERHPPGRMQVSATLSYRPFEEGVGGQDQAPGPDAWSEGILFLTDGAAGRRELLVELGRRLGSVQGSVSGSVGSVHGRLTPALEEAPVQILSLGEVRYYRTSLRASYLPTATEVKVDYRQVVAGSEGVAPEAPEPLDYRRLDLVVSQDLPWVCTAAGARFKVLMAYQELSYASLYDAAGGSAATPGTASRLSGGVEINF